MTLASSFPLRSLGEVSVNHDARRVPVKAADRNSGPYPYYGAQGIVDYVDDYIFDGVYLLVAEDGENLRSRNEDIAFMARGKFWVNNHAHILRASSDIATRFLHYAINASDVSGYITGSTIPKLSQRNLRSILIPCPSPEAQEKIVALLGALDDKIDLNRRMNETLEAMARAIFKDWFVDFGPTRAKAEGRDPYLAPELWGLFPDALDDEGKPVGWGQGILADVAESPRRGVSPSDISEDTPYIGLEHMPRRSIALSEWEGAGKVKSNKTQFHRGEILFGKLRPYFHKVGIAPLDGICSTDIVVTIPRAPDWGAFILACLSSDEFVDYTNRTSTGTKMPRTSWKTMAQYKVFLPPQQVACAFQDVTQSLLDRLGANIHETAALGETRDCLIPKLMSGEIRLRNVEKAMEAVVEEGNEGAIT